MTVSSCDGVVCYGDHDDLVCVVTGVASAQCQCPANFHWDFKTEKCGNEVFKLSATAGHLQPQNERWQLIKACMSSGEITGEHVYSPKMKGANGLKPACHQGRSLGKPFTAPK